MVFATLNKLESEIQDCEARVRLHDVRMRESAHLLRQGAADALSSKLVMAAGGLLAAGLGYWFVRRRPRHAHAGDDEAWEQRRSRLRRASTIDRLERWAPLLLPLVTPMLNRRVALSLAHLGLPVTARPVVALPTAPQLDLARYAGHWYEVARLPERHERDCARDVTAEYTLQADGRVLVRNRCIDARGKTKEAEGELRVPDASQPGQAEVSFAPAFLRWWPGAWADYSVLFVDDDYRCALVGTPERDRLWILSRTPTMEPHDVEALKALALRHGFDTSRLISTPHT